MGHDKEGKPVYSYDDKGRPIHTPPDEPIKGKIPDLKNKNGTKILDFNDEGKPIIGYDNNGDEVT